MDEERSRSWWYTLKEISAVSGVSIHSVRDAKQRGELVPWDLGNVAEWVAAKRMIARLKEES